MKQALAWSEYLLGNNTLAQQQMQELIKLKQEVYGVDNQVTQAALDMMSKIQQD